MPSAKNVAILVIAILFITSVVYAKENFQDKLERLFGIDMTEKISPPVPNSVTAQAVAVTKDVMPPVVGVMHWPSAPREGDTVKLTAVAYDASGISRLVIYVDDRSVKVCFTTTCTFEKEYEAGHHTYSVSAVDRKGNMGELPVDYTFDVLTTDGYLWTNAPPETNAGVVERNPTIEPDHKSTKGDNPGFNSDEEIEKLLASNADAFGGKLPPTWPRPRGNCTAGSMYVDKTRYFTDYVNIPKNCKNVLVKAWGTGGGAGADPAHVTSGGGGAFVSFAFTNPYYDRYDSTPVYMMDITPGQAGTGGYGGRTTASVLWRAYGNYSVVLMAGSGGGGGRATTGYTPGRGGGGDQNGEGVFGFNGSAAGGGNKGKFNVEGIGGLNPDGTHAYNGSCGYGYYYGAGGYSSVYGGGGGSGYRCGGGEGGRAYGGQAQGSSAGGGGGASYYNTTFGYGSYGAIIPGNFQTPGNVGDSNYANNAGRGGSQSNLSGEVGRVFVRWWGNSFQNLEAPAPREEPPPIAEQSLPSKVIGDERLYGSQNGFASNEEIANMLGSVGSNTGSELVINPRDGNQTPPVPYTCKPGSITTDNACGATYLAYVPRNCSSVVVKSWGGGGGAGFIPGKLRTGGGGAFAAAAFRNPYFNANSQSVDILLYIAAGSGACGGGNGTYCSQGGGTSFVNWRGGFNNTVLVRAGGGGSAGGAVGNYTAGKGGAGGQDGQNAVGKVGTATGGKTGTANHIGLGGMNGQGYLIPNATDGKCGNAAQGVGTGGVSSYPWGGGSGGSGGYCGGGEGGRSYNQSQGASAGGGGGGSFINLTTIPGMTGVIVPGSWEIPGYPGDPVRGNSGNGGTPANSGGKCGKVHVYWF